ncbi:hypothetical protein D3C78_1841110 [compost metagenome]
MLSSGTGFAGGDCMPRGSGVCSLPFPLALDDSDSAVVIDRLQSREVFLCANQGVEDEHDHPTARSSSGATQPAAAQSP